MDLRKGNVSQFGGVLVRTIPNAADGSFDLEYLRTLLHTVDDSHFPRAKAICIEASHNMMGGTVPSLEWLCKLRDFANEYGYRVHLDAARGFNAAAHLGSKHHTNLATPLFSLFSLDKRTLRFCRFRLNLYFERSWRARWIAFVFRC